MIVRPASNNVAEPFKQQYQNIMKSVSPLIVKNRDIEHMKLNYMATLALLGRDTQHAHQQ